MPSPRGCFLPGRKPLSDGCLPAYILTYSTRWWSCSPQFPPIHPMMSRLYCQDLRPLCRVGQQAVRNAVQHAAPSRVTVRLERNRDGRVERRVADDGCGFEPERILGATDRCGVPGLKERTESVGGSVALESEPGQGAVVRARVPPSESAKAERTGSDGHGAPT